MMSGPVSSQVAMGVAEEMIQRFSLNPDQAASLIHVAQMMTCEKPKGEEEHQSFPITIIRGTQPRIVTLAAVVALHKC